MHHYPVPSQTRKYLGFVRVFVASLFGCRVPLYAATTNYFTGFEISDGFTVSSGLVDQNGWVGLVDGHYATNGPADPGAAWNGIVSDTSFPASAQQGFVGSTPLPATDAYDIIYVWYPLNLNP